MNLNGTEHMHIIIAGMHIMVYMKFHASRINMPISLNGTEHMFINNRLECISCFIRLDA
jgi:hypothetical protein